MTTLGRALEDPSDLGQQIGKARGQRAQLGHRGGLLIGGQFPPAGPVAGLARQLGDEDTVSLRTPIDHAF
jgi:hypothetical protein